MAPHFYGDMSYTELHELREQRGYANRDARSLRLTRLLAMDQMESKRATKLKPSTR